MDPVRRSILVVVLLALACGPKPTEKPGPTPPQAVDRDAFGIYEQLEAAIESGQATEDDRVEAYRRAAAVTDDRTAAYAFARAALSGRVAELRGAKAGKLVTEAESWARQSIARDGEFRDRAATQLLGSLYVMAPGRLVEHGDSETGLEMLEALVEAKPEIASYRVRLAQAYVHLGDEDAAKPQLCASVSMRARLRRDELRLFNDLIDEVGGPDALGCGQPG
jgi:hypothetical protein